MFIECKACQSNDLDIISVNNQYLIVCNTCRKYLKEDDINLYKTIATQHHSSNYVSMLLFKPSVIYPIAK